MNYFSQLLHFSLLHLCLLAGLISSESIADNTTATSRDKKRGQGFKEEVVSGQILKEGGIPSSYLRQQLMYDLFDQVIYKYLGQKGKDVESFKSKWEVLKNNAQEEARTKVQARFGNIEKLTPKGLKDYQREAKKAELEARGQFSPLYHSIVSYSVLDFKSVSSKYYFMKMKLRLDHRSVTAYYDDISGSRSRVGGSGAIRLRIDIRVALSDLDWLKDFNLSNPGQFISPLEKSWLEWFQENKPTGVSDVELLSHNYSNLQMNDVILRVYAQVRKVQHNPLIHQYKFELTTDLGVIAAGSEEVLGNFDDIKDNKVFTLAADEDSGKLAQLVANALYRVPLGHFHEVKRLIDRKKPYPFYYPLVIADVKNSDEAFELQGYLSNRIGGVINFDTVQKTPAEGVQYAYRLGTTMDATSLKQLLSSIKELPAYGKFQIEMIGDQLMIKKSTL